MEFGRSTPHPRGHARVHDLRGRDTRQPQGRRYKELAAASIVRHGGRYIVRGAQPEAPGGNWPTAQRVVVVEFPTMDRLRSWHAPDDYAEALVVSETALTRRLLGVPGVEDVEAS